MTGGQHESASVSDEALRLVAALAGMGAAPGAAPDGSGGRTDGTEGSTRDDEPAASSSAGAAPAACACATPGVEAVCQVCPVCRVAAFLAEVRPETVERVADLLGMVAGSLQAFAAQRRSDQATVPTREDGGADEGERASAAGWEPIDIVDDDGSTR